MVRSEQDPALTQHLRALALEQGLSVRTVESYRRDLLQFAQYLGERGGTFEEASSDDIRGFLAEGAWRPSSRARKAAAIRSFYRRRVVMELATSDPSSSIAGPRLESTLPRTLSVEEISMLLDTPKATPLGLRDRALLEVLYGAGLRASEVLTLRLQDIDFDVGFVRTIGKGDKERVVPLGRKALEALRAYNERGRPQLGGAGKMKAPELFLNNRGRRLSRPNSSPASLLHSGRSRRPDLNPARVRPCPRLATRQGQPRTVRPTSPPPSRPPTRRRNASLMAPPSTTTPTPMTGGRRGAWRTDCWADIADHADATGLDEVSAGWRYPVRSVHGGRRGGERFRLRTSSKVKRAEEGDDDLVNHLSQPYKRRFQSARFCSRRLSECEICRTGCVPRPGSRHQLGGLTSPPGRGVAGTSNSDWDRHTGLSV